MSDYTVLTQNDNGQKKYLVRKAGYTGGGSSSGGTAIDAYTKTETDNLLANKQDKGDYALKSEIPDINGKQDKLVAGENITIEGNVISSTGGSVDLSNYATKQFAKDANFPSSRYDELTLGASGSKYVAPANGWFIVHKKSGKEKAWLNIETPLFMSSYMSPSSGEIVTVRAEVLKGTQISVTYDMPGATQYFRFVYSQGENEDV